MPSDPELADIIQLGHDITSFKLYLISATALWFYDYFLTVNDEIRYVWKSENTLIFVVFLLARYIPAPYFIWAVVVSWSESYTSEMCMRTAFIELMYAAFITVFAQIILSQRTYAITMKSKWIAGILYTVAAIQFGVGAYVFMISALHPALSFPTLPLDSYHLCLSSVPRLFIIVQVSLSLGFDITVFALVIAQTQIIKARNRGMNTPSILSTVSRDAGIYFAVISTSHFLAVLTYSVTRPLVLGIALVGNSVFVPMMVTRMVISLKKAARSQQLYVNREVPIGVQATIQDCCSPRHADGIQLSVFAGEELRPA